METVKIAVLLATYNRKDVTLACLNGLFNQMSEGRFELTVFLTDDASTDGTADAVKRLYPMVNILSGDGSLFWAGGMRNSWSKAAREGYDYYLLLNDDTILKPDTIYRLVSYSLQQLPKHAIFVGTTVDKSTGNISYGGQKLYDRKKVQSYKLHSDTEVLECDMANANIMLVPDTIVKEIGILSDSYTHSIADYDYTLRAKKSGYDVKVIPGISGYCTDDHGNNWKSSNVSLKNRIKYLKSPKGLAYSEYLHFIRQHFPTHLPAAFIKLWMKTIFPGLWDRFKPTNV